MTGDDDPSSRPIEGYAPGVGVRIHYLDWGAAPDPPIVLLHGGGLNAHTWRRVCGVLRSGFRCITPDLRGHGDSEWHPDGDYAPESHAADVEALASALGLGRLVLVGMSLGGSVALTCASTHPERVAGLVMIDTGPGGSRDEGRRRLGQLMEGRQEYASIDEAFARALAVNPGRPRDQLRWSLERNMRQTPAGTWTWKWDPRIRWRATPMTAEEQQAFAEERSQRLWAAAASVTCPTLIVRGGDSDMFLDEDAATTVAGFRRAGLVTIPGAGHSVQSDRPHELAEAIRQFVVEDVGSMPG